ncbi:hypothetical protein [Clostridium sp. UBA6640]|uniref:hypothetical protein n=1 Tax=Clostridium sp. UBA6640 TaxID=1946370 RepID=UPI0025B985C2|nr:hypothetical protein [Clostridium sp. UBA6640]
MRITEFDLEIEDLEWYAIDGDDNIAQFTTGGTGRVPEFICESRENLDIVCEYFDALSIYIAEAKLINKSVAEYPSDNYLEECINMTRKGIFCYDVSNGKEHLQDYQLVSKPDKELYLSDLPKQIQEILINYRINNTCFSKEECISVVSAY